MAKPATAFVLAALLLIPSPLVFAGQTVIIDTDVTYPVFGNGDGTGPDGLPNGVLTGSNPINLRDPNNNEVSVNGTAGQHVYGGYAYSNTFDGSITASGNTVNVSGTVSRAVYGGYATGRFDNFATYNTVTINEGATFGTFSRIYGVFGIGVINGSGGTVLDNSYDLFTGNTLNLNTGADIPVVGGFETINFGNIGTAGITTLNVNPVVSADQTIPVKLNTAGNNIMLDGQITGSGGIEKTGAGTLTLTNAANDYSGGTTVSEGLINFNDAGNFGNASSKITLNGGGLQWAAGNTADISGRLNALGNNGGIFDTNGNDVELIRHRLPDQTRHGYIDPFRRQYLQQSDRSTGRYPRPLRRGQNIRRPYPAP